jgi:hypothetical protein
MSKKPTTLVANRDIHCRGGRLSTLRFSLLFSFLRLSFFDHVTNPVQAAGAFMGRPRELRTRHNMPPDIAWATTKRQDHSGAVRPSWI